MVSLSGREKRSQMYTQIKGQAERNVVGMEFSDMYVVVFESGGSATSIGA